MTEYIKKLDLIKECNYPIAWDEEDEDEKCFGISEASIDFIQRLT